MDILTINKVSHLCMDHYKRGLSNSGKPLEKQWTPMAAFVIEKDKIFEVISMATGTKCLGAKTIASTGICDSLIVDSHAEVLARRGAIRFLYNELQKEEQTYFVKSIDGDYSLENDVNFHLFLTSYPCGDGSIFVKKEEDLGGECSIFIKKEENRGKRTAKEISKGDVNDVINSPPAKKIRNNNYKDKLNIHDISVKKEMIFDDIDTVLKNQKLLIKEENDLKSDCKRITRSNATSTIRRSSRLINDNIMKKQIKKEANNSLDKYDLNRTGAKCVPNGKQDKKGKKLKYHTAIGALRTKPGRGDPSKSMCCSDKIMRWIAMGFQGNLLKHFIKDILTFKYIIVNIPISNTVVSLQRALLKRINCLDVLILPCNVDFVHSFKENKTPAPSSILWYKGIEKQEVIVKGLLQGWTYSNKNNPRARSKVSKIELFKLFKEIHKIKDEEKTYQSYKKDAIDHHYIQFFKRFKYWCKSK